MDIGKLFGHAWGLFTKDIGPLIVTTIVAALAAGIPAVILFGSILATSEWTLTEEGTLTGTPDVSWPAIVVGSILVTLITIFVVIPFYASMVSIMLRRVREGRVAEYGDMFAGFRQFGQVVSTYLLIGIIVGLLSVTIIGIPFAIYFGVLWVYAIVLVVDRGVGFGQATGASKELVRRTGWWMTFLSLFVAAIVFGIIGSILNIIPVVGPIVAGLLYPLMLAYVVGMYFQASGEVQLVDNAVAGLPPAAGAGPYGAPPAGGPYAPPPPPPAGAGYAPPAPPAAAAGAPPAPGEATEGGPATGQDAWTAASDPLAGQRPVAPPLGTVPGTEPAAGEPAAPAAPPPPEAPQPPVGESPAGASAEPAAVTAAPVPTQEDQTEPHVHTESGQLVRHCSQCGAVIEGSAEFCQVCAHEVSGGETPPHGAVGEAEGEGAPANGEGAPADDETPAT